MGHYSPVRGKVPNEEDVLNAGVTVTRLPLEEIEAMLAREYGRKLEPVRKSLRRWPRGKSTQITTGKLVEFPVVRRDLPHTFRSN